MSLAIVSELSVAYGPKVLFDKASFSVGRTDRVGLVGANGTGKSTLMKILAGLMSPDSGTIQWSRGARAGYLPQDVFAMPRGPLLETVLASVPGRKAQEDRLEATAFALRQVEDTQTQLDLSQTLVDIQESLEHFEERYGRPKAERILAGLGFAEEQFCQLTSILSGGWRMRAALASLLLQDPDVLLLDEPTNHLDVPTLEWFDEYLGGTGKALMLVCHDREFLDRHIGRVISLEVEGLRAYAGNYGDYLEQRAIEVEQLEAKAARQQARRAEIQAFVDRFRAKATKARQVQSRVKMLEKEQIVDVLGDRATLSFRFGEVPRSGREVVSIRGAVKAFGDKVVYRDLNATVLRGERIGLIGANGAGKTTLLKMVAGELEPDRGAVALGHAVSIGYYAQHHFDPQESWDRDASAAQGVAALDPDRRILDALWELVPNRPEAYVRNVAGSFLFSGDDVDKPVGVLSGGERARVALAKLLLVPSNLLLLDEPTNHLDLSSSEALIEALAGYGGTIVFVSHNKSLLNRLATQLWEVAGGGVAAWPGNLDDWLRRKAGGASEPVEIGAHRRADGDRERRRAEAEARNIRYRREKPIREEIASLEARIAALEAEQKVHEAALADSELYLDFARARPHMDAHRDNKAKLEELYARWEHQQELLAALSRA